MGLVALISMIDTVKKILTNLCNETKFSYVYKREGVRVCMGYTSRGYIKLSYLAWELQGGHLGYELLFLSPATKYNLLFNDFPCLPMHLKQS